MLFLNKQLVSQIKNIRIRLDILAPIWFFTALLLLQAVDKDKSGYISVVEFKLFFKCLGLDNEHAAVAFAIIDTNGVSRHDDIPR